MGSSDPEVIVDQVGNLSASKETVLFLGLLFLQTDSSFEVRIMDGFVQCWSNPRIESSKFGIWIPLIDDEDIKSSTESTISSFLIHSIASVRKLWASTNLSLDSYLPTSKRWWCGEFVKVKICNLQSLLVCPIILWRSSPTKVEWISGWRSWLASRDPKLYLVFGFHGRDLLRPSPTRANFFLLRPVLLRPVLLRPVLLRPSPTQADLFVYLGQAYLGQPLFRPGLSTI